ncbi:hypothetical protein Hanom_Chr15g01337141 [Helianthus anomalus]
MKNLRYGSPLEPSSFPFYMPGWFWLGWVVLTCGWLAWKGGSGLGSFKMGLCLDALTGFLVSWDGLWFGSNCFCCCFWAGYMLVWAGVIRGRQVEPSFRSSWCYKVACLLSLFIWTIVCVLCCFPSLLTPKVCRRHLGVVGLVCVFGINTNMGVIRQEWFGRMSFRCYPKLFPTPKPNPLGNRNLVCLINCYCLCCSREGAGTGWVWYNRWNVPKSLMLMLWWLLCYRFTRVMLLDLGRRFGSKSRAAESWIHHIGRQMCLNDHHTPHWPNITILFWHIRFVMTAEFPGHVTHCWNRLELPVLLLLLLGMIRQRLLGKDESWSHHSREQGRRSCSYPLLSLRHNVIFKYRASGSTVVFSNGFSNSRLASVCTRGWHRFTSAIWNDQAQFICTETSINDWGWFITITSFIRIASFYLKGSRLMLSFWMLLETQHGAGVGVFNILRSSEFLLVWEENYALLVLLFNASRWILEWLIFVVANYKARVSPMAPGWVYKSQNVINWVKAHWYLWIRGKGRLSSNGGDI